MIRVSVAASSSVLRSGLEAVVRSSNELELVEVTSIEALDHGLSEAVADVLLVELRLLDEHWISVLGVSSSNCVVLTQSPDAALLVAALRTNIRAVLSTDASSAEIVAAICAAAADLITLQLSSFELVATDPRPTPAALEEDLTQRELEVLQMLAGGLSNKLIAHALGISEHTVKFHVQAVMAKLHASSRTDAVMQGIRRGLILI